MIAPIPEDFDLKHLREAAALSQTALAKRIGVSQSQIQRWETNPDSVPLKVLREWIAMCGNPAEEKAMDAGAPYSLLTQQLALLEEYARNEPELRPGDTVAPPIGIEALLTALRELGRKPRVVLSGRFDSGKSRLANTLLGINDYLPTAYQPTTRVVCLIRHIDDKPQWQRESIWIMDSSFNLEDAGNHEKCLAHRLLAGDSETLRIYGTHRETDSDFATRASAALIYLDAPILKVCDLVDAPGLGHEENDDALAKSTKTYGDVILYLSPFVGFMNAQDIQAISALLESLPAQPGEAPLRSFSVLATHAHPGIADDDLEQALASGAHRLTNMLGQIYESRADSGVVAPDATTVRQRFFPWYVESPRRRAAFETNLVELLGTILPRAIYERLDDAVAVFRDKVRASFQHETEQKLRLLNEREEAARQIRNVIAEEPTVQARVKDNVIRVNSYIDEARIATADFIEHEIKPHLTKEAIEQLLNKHFLDRRKEAEQEAANVILIELRGLMESFIRDRTAPLVREIDHLLAQYLIEADTTTAMAIVPFDPRAAFLGGIAGAGTFGALAGWAAIVAGGSNLGAYLLVPQVVSLLSSLGISIAGGTATGVSIVAALGGPVTVGVVLASAVGVLAWQLFGRSWQSRLARQLANQFEKDDLLGKIQKACARLWDDTALAFQTGIKEATERRKHYIAGLRNQLDTPEHELRAQVARVDARRSFLSYIPWKPLIGNAP